LFVTQRGSELAGRLKGTYLKWEEAELRGLGGFLGAGRLGRRFQEMGAEIVHVHDSASQAVCELAARLAGKPRVVVTRRTEFPLRWASIAKYRLCDKVICVSEAVRRRCRDAGLPERLLTVAPDFVDCRHFDPVAVQTPTQAGRIAMVGRLSRTKGHRVMLRAMKEIARAEPEARLVIYGVGEEEQTLRGQANALGLAERVEFAGFASDVRTALAAAELLVMPSLSEGLGVAALEAMAMGKPVVASNAGGLPEAVAHGETGLVTRAGDAHGLAEAVIALLRDRERARRMGAEGRQRARALFDRPRVVERVLEVYDEVLRRPGS
jgi:glycosyltransferase involved in cell wall biosynthesis